MLNDHELSFLLTLPTVVSKLHDFFFAAHEILVSFKKLCELLFSMQQNGRISVDIKV